MIDKSVFSYLFDTVIVNSQTLWALNNHIPPKTTNSFKYADQLAVDLAYAHLKYRNNNALHSHTKKKIESFLNVNKPTNLSVQSIATSSMATAR